MAENKKLENTEVVETTETYNKPKDKPKKGKNFLIALIILGLLGAGGYSLYNTMVSIEKQKVKLEPGKENAPIAIEANDSGRYMDTEFGGEGNEEKRNASIQGTIERHKEKEHMKTEEKLTE